jgi:hypothetical protein
VGSDQTPGASQTGFIRAMPRLSGAIMAAPAAGRLRLHADHGKMRPRAAATQRLRLPCFRKREIAMLRIVLRAIWIGCLGMLLAMLAAFAIVVATLIFDPKCGAGDSGGCAMGLVTVTLGAALPGFVIGFVGHLALAFWRRRPALPTIRQLRDWGRED